MAAGTKVGSLSQFHYPICFLQSKIVKKLLPPFRPFLCKAIAPCARKGCNNSGETEEVFFASTRSTFVWSVLDGVLGPLCLPSHSTSAVLSLEDSRPWGLVWRRVKRGPYYVRKGGSLISLKAKRRENKIGLVMARPAGTLDVEMANIFVSKSRLWSAGTSSDSWRQTLSFSARRQVSLSCTQVCTLSHSRYDLSIFLTDELFLSN